MRHLGYLLLHNKPSTTEMLKIMMMYSFSQGCGLDGCRVEVAQAWWLLPGFARVRRDGRPARRLPQELAGGWARPWGCGARFLFMPGTPAGACSCGSCQA